MSSLPLNPWLRLGRAALSGYAGILILIALAGTILFPAYAQLHAAEFIPNNSWTSAQVQVGLAQLGLPATFLAYENLVSALVLFIAGGGVAMLLLWRRPASWFILYLAFMLISIRGGETFSAPLAAALPGLEAYSHFMQATGWQFFFILFFFFPNGRPVPRWTGWVGYFWLGLIVLYLFFPGFSLFNQNPVLDYLFDAMVFSALASQFYRYFKRSDPVQRQQTKWIVAVLILMLVVGFGTGPLLSITPSGSDLRHDLVLALIKNGLDPLLFSSIPLAILLAIFRYRLWDIDLIIRRTLQYAALTAALGLVFFGSVLLLQQVFGAFSGQDSPAIVVLSTLAIVVLFSPLRRRIQAAIDRRFYRTKYNAEQAVTAFAEAARSEVELDVLADRLAGAARDSLHPESVSIWIRK